MAKPVPKPRVTLARQIKVLAATDPHRAILLADMGWDMTDDERQINLFHRELNHMKEKDSWLPLIPTRRQARTLRALERTLKNQRKKFTDELVNAIEDFNFKTFLKFAKALERLKTLRGLGDRWRTEILNLKRTAELTGVTLTLRQLAAALSWPNRNSADGCSQLRRLCKELQYPIKPSRRIRGR